MNRRGSPWHRSCSPLHAGLDSPGLPAGIPVDGALPPLNRHDPSSPFASTRLAMRLLIAEDQVHLCHLLKGMLCEWGYEPVVVNDGPAALEVLRAADAPRLALLDWIMPGMDGIQV